MRTDIYEQDIEKYLDPSPVLGYAFDSSCIDNEIIGQEKENLKSKCVSFLIARTKKLFTWQQDIRAHKRFFCDRTLESK